METTTETIENVLRKAHAQKTVLIGPEDQFSITKNVRKSYFNQSMTFSKRLGRKTTKLKKKVAGAGGYLVALEKG